MYGSAVLTVSLQTLRDLLIEEAKFLSGVSGQVEQVERDLKTMHCLLMDADKWSNKHNPATLRDWIHDLNDLAFKAENVLEKYVIGVTSKRGGDLLKKLKRYACILTESSIIHQVGKETEDIRSRVSDLTVRLKSMSPGESSHSLGEDHQLRLRFAHEVEEHFVGMEKDIERLLSLLKNDDERPNRVISICGMGGLGKTSLARKIYNHNDVQFRFDARAWVCVTQEFRGEEVLRELLKQFLPEERKEQVNGMNHNELVVKLHTVQMQKKCLIVIDDIWHDNHWKSLKPAFSSNCKVLLTTRNEKVASQERRTLHKLDYLTEDQGWELLQKIALPINYSPVAEMEATGREIVQKCGHLPLAISVIGGILRQKVKLEDHTPILEEWKMVSSNIDSSLMYEEGVGDNEKINQVLDLSYDALPYTLKSCFLYLGCYGEDEEIDTEQLYVLWMAEGLISSEDKRSSETLRDVAERYLSELAFRCMVQLQKDELYNKFFSCRLHDLMRELCLSKGVKQQFIKRIDFGRHKENVDNIISRLALSFDGGEDDDHINKIGKFEDLRSFLILNRKSCMAPAIGSKDTIINFDKSKSLRILVLEDCEFKSSKLPNEVGKLIHLRYLSLFQSNVEELPLSVCNLPYLQILDLRVKYSIRLRLPNAIYKLKRLRHLFLRNIDVSGKLLLDGLKELETLQAMYTDNICIADIPKLTNLRKLSIKVTDMDSLSIIVNHMSDNCSKLRETRLNIERCDFSSEKGSNIFTNMLMSHSLFELNIDSRARYSWPCYQPGMSINLVTLSLGYSGIEGDVMEILGKFPMLKSILLCKVTLISTEIICRANSFPQLKSLELNGLHDLEKWRVDEGAMPNLSELVIWDCPKLEMIPDGLKFITTLRELKTYGMPKEFNDRLRVLNGRQGEDYHKVCHIPSIELHDK